MGSQRIANPPDWRIAGHVGSSPTLTANSSGGWPSRERHRAVAPDLLWRLRRWFKSITAHQTWGRRQIGKVGVLKTRYLLSVRPRAAPPGSNFAFHGGWFGMRTFVTTQTAAFTQSSKLSSGRCARVIKLHRTLAAGTYPQR